MEHAINKIFSDSSRLVALVQKDDASITISQIKKMKQTLTNLRKFQDGLRFMKGKGNFAWKIILYECSKFAKLSFFFNREGDVCLP